jgi:hypothetical protein
MVDELILFLDDGLFVPDVVELSFMYSPQWSLQRSNGIPPGDQVVALLQRHVEPVQDLLPFAIGPVFLIVSSGTEATGILLRVSLIKLG